MAVILENRQIAEQINLLRVRGVLPARAGQFYMLRLPQVDAPFLGRPISVFACSGDEVSFQYKIVGQGTSLFSTLQSGQTLDVQGPYGNGFPLTPGDAVLIGGGMGTAPLYYLAKRLREDDPTRRIVAHLGFRNEAYALDEFERVCDAVICNIGGFVADDVDFTQSATYYACGPEPMLIAAYKRAQGARLYVSLEKHMACGVGACLGCTCRSTQGNRRVCKDGPVFLAAEVFADV